MKTLLAALLFVIVAVPRVTGPDLSGRWILNLDPGPRGNFETVECTLGQTGQTLVVKCGSGTGQMTGEVNGRKVSFRTPVEAETKPGYVMSFDGVVNEARTTLEGTWRFVFIRLSERREGKFRASRKR